MEEIANFKIEFLDAINTTKDFKKLVKDLDLSRELNSKLEKTMIKLIEDFITRFNK